MTTRVGILTVSNPIYWGTREDECAPLVGEWVRAHVPAAQVELEALVQQRRNVIQGTLQVWADEVDLDLIFTLGEAGPAPHDSAIQAARAITERPVCQEPVVAGLRGHTLIVNLSDEPEAIRAVLDQIASFLGEPATQPTAVPTAASTTAPERAGPGKACSCLPGMALPALGLGAVLATRRRRGM